MSLMIIGESFVGTGVNAAHVNTVLGPRDGVIDRSKAGDLALIAAVWVNPSADTTQAVHENEVTATLRALRSGMSGGPGIDEFRVAARAPFNPYFELT
jgi:formaldehyde-activating enzyme involved in methanogenesis